MSTTADITSQPTHVFRPEQLPSKNRGGGARTIPLVTAARGGTTYLNGVTIFEPGAAIGHHIHNVAESVMVIKGTAIVDINGERTPLNTYDTTFVPANVPHHFENASETEEMRILWTYGSLDATRTLTESGEHGRVDAESADPAAAVRLVTEMATIKVLAGHQKQFEAAVAEAVHLFQQAHGARTFRLEASEEEPTVYRLFVGWESIDDHTSLFRGSDAFLAWRELIGPHIDGTPEVEHLRNVLTGF